MTDLEMTAAAQQSLDQWLPVPRAVWTQLKIDPLQKMAELWGSWPIDVRQQWMTWAKVEPSSAGWTQLSVEDRNAILRVMQKVRGIYVASDLTTNWRIIRRVL